jgi:ABC-2 type transport system permease protein
MMRALLLRQLRHHAVLLASICVAVMVFEIMVIRFIAALDEGGGIRAILEAVLPPEMQRLVMEQFGVASWEGGIAFGFQHPLVMVAMIAFVVAAASVPAAERESGLLDLILARPVPRERYLGAHWLLVTIAALLFPLALLLGVAIGTESTAAIVDYVPAAAALVPLLLLIGGYTLLAATQARRRGPAIAGAVALTLFSYWIDFMAAFWERLEPWRWISPFTYFDPVRIATDGLVLRDPLVLLAAAAACVLAAFVNFRRQDV